MTQTPGKAQQIQMRPQGLGKGVHELHGAGSMTFAEWSQVH